MRRHDDFIKYAVTDRRVEQGIEYLKENGAELSRKSTGMFLSWIAGDIQSEESDVLEESGIDWNDVGRQASAVARDKFFRKLNELDKI